MSSIKIFGVLLIAFSIVCAFLIVANQSIKPPGGHSLVGLIPQALVAAVIGIGLWLEHKRAGILFGILCALLSAWLCIGSLLTVPLPWLLINLSLAALLLAPCIAVARCWSILR